jgi:hypothetical protein
MQGIDEKNNRKPKEALPLKRSISVMFLQNFIENGFVSYKKGQEV